MRHIKTIRIDYSITGTEIRIPFSAVCSVTDKQFSGEVRIAYAPVRLVLEYVDIEEKITALCARKLTAEELVEKTFILVWSGIKPKGLRVTVDVRKSEAHRPVVVWKERGIVKSLTQ